MALLRALIIDVIGAAATSAAPYLTYSPHLNRENKVILVLGYIKMY